MTTHLNAIDITDFDSNTATNPTYENRKGTEIGTISGIYFKELRNGGVIDTITGSVRIDTLTNSYVRYPISGSGNPIIERGMIKNISGGTIGTLSLARSDTSDAPSFSVGTISGGTITEINVEGQAIIQKISNQAQIGTLNIYSYSSVEEISGGTITALTISQQNEFYQKNIGKISGGTITTLTNTGGNIGSISGGKITNLNNKTYMNAARLIKGKIDSISGGEIGTLTNENSAVISNISGGHINTLNNQVFGEIQQISGGTINTLNNQSYSLNTISGGYIGNLTNTGTINTILATAKIGALNNTGTINNLTLHNGNIGLNANGYHLNGTIDQLNIDSWILRLDAPATEWNTENTGTADTANSHIFNAATINSWNIAPKSIVIDIGDNADSGEYELKKLITGTGEDNIIDYSHLRLRQGLEFDKNGDKFRLRANASESLGAKVFQNMALNFERKNIMTQNLLDSLTPQHFGGFFKSVDTIDEMGEKWRFFALPYAVLGSYKPNGEKVDEFGGGVLVGAQRDIQDKGVLSAYLGYEYDNTKAELSSTSATINTNTLQIGVIHNISFDFDDTKQWYIKSNLRGQFALPKFSEDTLDMSADLGSYSAGIEGRAGLAWNLTDKSYLAPELGISYDALMLDGFTLSSAGNATETYSKHTWHLPQILGGVKWYQAYGDMFRTSVTAGVHYNLLNKPSVEFSIAKINDKSEIELPSFYANVGLNAIWQISPKSEVSVGYSGVYHSNGLANSLAFKYALKF